MQILILLLLTILLLLLLLLLLLYYGLNLLLGKHNFNSNSVLFSVVSINTGM